MDFYVAVVLIFVSLAAGLFAGHAAGYAKGKRVMRKRSSYYYGEKK